jgi:hypothetical protein
MVVLSSAAAITGIAVRNEATIRAITNRVLVLVFIFDQRTLGHKYTIRNPVDAVFQNWNCRFRRGKPYNQPDVNIFVSIRAEENRRIIMEVLFRHRASGGDTVSLDDMSSLDFIDSSKLHEDIEYLGALDYLELHNGHVRLTELGFTLMQNREFSYCPHL